mmetsp:Transcript_4323/g.9669  ORF Transcript_4323/g.9669 Transcript_4323/m.9669 type:complete len:248 (-) Transcript_4323:2204-2947(-)
MFCCIDILSSDPDTSVTSCFKSSATLISSGCCEVIGNERISSRPSSETGKTSALIRNLSNKASRSSDSGSSLDAPITHFRGHCTRFPAPLSNCRSFNMVRSVLRIAEFALKISSRNATVAVGRNPSMQRVYSSFSSARRLSGPKISSGVVNRVKRRWKKGPPQSMDRRLPSSLLLVPGGPMNKTCSSDTIPRTTNLASTSRSTSPDCTKDMQSKSALLFFHVELCSISVSRSLSVHLLSSIIVVAAF